MIWTKIKKHNNNKVGNFVFADGKPELKVEIGTQAPLRIKKMPLTFIPVKRKKHA
jgi:prepilin-type processing-associated H-X9-DG protein